MNEMNEAERANVTHIAKWEGSAWKRLCGETEVQGYFTVLDNAALTKEVVRLKKQSRRMKKQSKRLKKRVAALEKWSEVVE